MCTKCGQIQFMCYVKFVISYILAGKKPRIVTDLEDITVIAPKPAKFTCEISGGDASTKMRWFKESKEIYDGKRYKMTFDKKVGTLTISDTELTDAAEYRCEAANKQGRVESAASLVVHGE